MKRSAFGWILGAVVLPVACGARSTLELASGVGGGGGSDNRGGGGNATTTSASTGGGGSTLDAGPPPHDAAPDAIERECPEFARYIYAWVPDLLYRFDPVTTEFKSIGSLGCVSTDPTGLAVDRKGNAYLAAGGDLLKVNLETLACEKTAFVPSQQGFNPFGLTFLGAGASEVLYAVDQSDTDPSRGLATIDLDTFAFRFVTPFQTDISGSVEIAGTGDGRLFALSWLAPAQGTVGEQTRNHVGLDEIDPTKGAAESDEKLPLGTTNRLDELGVAAWGKSLYVFTNGERSRLEISRFDPSDGSTTTIKTIRSGIGITAVGASTCASD